MCTRCRSPLAHVWVRTAYEGLARDLIHTMKFGRARAASRPISDLMLEALPYGLSVDTWVVPVPTASARVRQRGYDHAALLAKRVAGQRGFTFNNSLRRLGNARQVGATRQKRQTQLEGAFYCPRPEVVQGRNILLVDDIVTTGASIERAAKVLRQAGARSVSALIFAQKQ
jgi:ComF family protein